MDLETIEEENLVEEYVTGRLAPEAEARFEELFLEHPELAAQVANAERLRSGLQALAIEEAVKASLASRLWQQIRRRPYFTLAPWMLLLALAVPLGLQVRDNLELRSRLDAVAKVQVNTPIFELGRFRSSALDAEPYLLSLAPEPEWIVLTLEAPPPERVSYRVTLRSPEGQLRWQAEGLRPDALGRLVFTLPSNLLPPGDLVLTVMAGGENAEDTALARFPLRVTSSQAG